VSNGRKRNIQFEKIANDYDCSLPSHVVAHYLAKRSRYLTTEWGNRPAHALDVGAGTGVLAERLQSAGWNVIGTDIAFAMQRVMYDRGGAASQASSTRLPFADATFDVVFCVAMLHHVAEPVAVRETVREMVRVAKPGGMIVYWDHNPFNPYWPNIMSRVPQDTGEERLIPEAEIRSDLAGLSVVVASHQMGFVGDFVPPGLLKLFQLLESVVESIPGMRRIICAHNVIKAQKL